MSRYIDADKIDWRLIRPINPNVADEHMIYEARRLVESQPTADVREVVRGEWGSHGECPFCGYLRQWEEDNFCGNCGARMDGGRDDKQKSD